tara:strand:- start:1 stop:2670 length:2670 start_codon:yes stop_codon:yes gene_type:complete
MATYYIDWEGGNDSNDGTSFANRKKTQHGFQGVSVTGGDEIRFAGKPRQLLDSNAKIWNWFGWKPYHYDSIGTINYSSTTGQTTITWNSHGCETGETVGIDQNTNHTNFWDRINGMWEVTKVDDNTLKLNDYTAPAAANGTSGSGGNIRKMKALVVQLSSEKTQELASNGQRDLAWTASANVTCSLQTTTGTWDSNVPMQSCAYSDKIEIADGFGTGKAAYWETGTLNLSGYQQVSYLVRQTSGTRTSQGTGSISSPNISLRLCTDTSGDTSVHTIPVVTGADTGQMWRDFTKDFGTNLNSSIRSIALYVDSDNGAQTFNFDNIIACKAKSAADSLTLNSVVGLGTQPNCPQYYKIGSIYKKNIRLLVNERNNARYPYSYYSPGGVTWDGGVGIARTANTHQVVNMYKIEPTQIVEDMGIEPVSGSWSNYSPNWFYMSSKSGISTTNRLKISGGWDVSNNMATQHAGGYSALNSHTTYGYLITFNSCNYTDFSNFMGISALQNISFSSCNYGSFRDIGGVSCYYYAVMLTSCSYGIGGMNIWGSLGQYPVYLSSCSNWNDYKDQNVGLTTMHASTAYGQNIYISSCHNTDIYKIVAKQPATGHNVYLTSSNGNRYEYLDLGDQPYGGSSNSGIYANQCTGLSVGICTVRNQYYGTNFQNCPDVIFDRLDFFKDDWDRSHGSNGVSYNSQYGTYHQSNAESKIFSGTWEVAPYIYGSNVYTDNVLFNYSGNPSYQYDNWIFCKNYDGTAGEFKNFYRHGTVNPDTSTRHTASGYSWKVDIDNGNPTSSSPIEWEVAKVIVNANAQVTASIWVYRDGTGVNGGLRVKANAIEGVTSKIDAVISDTTVNSWVQCSLNFTPTSSGTVTIYAMGYYINNASHNVWLDDFSVTQA